MSRDVKGVQILGGTRLLLTFDNGERREVDIAAIVRPAGVFSALHDPAFFGAVRVNPEIGTIVWPNGADLCPDVLYEQGHAVSSRTDAA